ncbi:MAG: hypothetical protein ACYDD4_00540 [Acidimicrobiales bacterium]
MKANTCLTAVRSSTVYEPPAVTIHGALTSSTGASLIGPVIDNNMAQGMLIINNTSL